MPLTELVHFVPPHNRPATNAQLDELRDEVAELKARLEAVLKHFEQVPA